MTDLPRFTAGSLGPIGFNQVNEMMRRLDALRPFIESVELSQNGIDGAKESVMIVYAKRSSDANFSERYDWREIAIRSKDRDNETEVIAHFEEEDWEEIETEVVTRGGEVVDEKGDELDTYAISAVPLFDEGFALCFARRSLDGTRRYVLIPIGGEASTPVLSSDLFRIESIIGDGDSVPYSDGIGSAACFIYSARRIVVTTTNGNATLAQTSDVFFFYDFGLANPNIPAVPDNVQLTPVPLQVGTFFKGSTVEIAPGQRIGYLAMPPRLDVECE